jgi:hypothetical protein
MPVITHLNPLDKEALKYFDKTKKRHYEAVSKHFKMENVNLL